MGRKSLLIELTQNKFRCCCQPRKSYSNLLKDSLSTNSWYCSSNECYLTQTSLVEPLYIPDSEVSTTVNHTSWNKWQFKTTTDGPLFLLCTAYDVLSSTYSSLPGCSKFSCSHREAAPPAYIMSPFSDRFIDFSLPSAPSLKLFYTRTNWDRYCPTAWNRSLANWKRWTLSPADP